MTILGLDTTSEFASLAVRSENSTVAELELYSPDGFAHVIYAAIERVIQSAGIRLDQIDCFAAASGPGSFTGVRVGLSAVKGLAEALGKTAAGVSNLQALASFGTAPRRAVVLDARRGEVYAAVYDEHLELVLPETVLKFSDWLPKLTEPEYEFISSCIDPQLLSDTRFARMPCIQPPRSLAAAIASCAELSGGVDPAALDANYVRRSDAELFWRDGAES